jgi:hypothetical protein
MTLEQIKAALKKLRADAERIERDLHQHVAAATDAKLHALLHRLRGVTRDFRLTLATPPSLNRHGR